MSQHFKFPFRWNQAGRATVVAQDSDEEIQQGVQVLLLSHTGERLEVPSFGIEDQTFREEADVEYLARTAAEWDERVDVDVLESGSGMVRDLLVQLADREG